jgi:hypothetical protein
MKAYLVAFACLFAASPALAQTMGGTMTGNGSALSDQASAETPESTSTAPAGGERLICRRVPTDSSSHMGSRRICLTAEGWRQQQRQNQG